MGQVSASSTVLIDAAPEAVLSAVADYQTVRPKILSPHYREYRVLEGGQGAGTVAAVPELPPGRAADAVRPDHRRRRAVLPGRRAGEEHPMKTKSKIKSGGWGYG